MIDPDDPRLHAAATGIANAFGASGECPLSLEFTRARAALAAADKHDAAQNVHRVRLNEVTVEQVGDLLYHSGFEVAPGMGVIELSRAITDLIRSQAVVDAH